jgi:HEAT repeat protein
VRRLSFLCILAAASQALRAEEAKTPFLIFREADLPTTKRIKDFVTEKQLGGRSPDTRREVREELARIGPWCVPFLATALRKESSARIRLNAVIALMLIRDPRGLPALRAAARDDDDVNVRRASTLAIGTFECPVDFGELRGLLETPRGEWRAVAPALARGRSPEAAPFLAAKIQPKHLPRDEHDAAATVLSAVIAADVAPVDLLDHPQRLVQEAAAAGLSVKPLPPARAGELLNAFRRTKARVAAIRALGAIPDRPADVQAELLDIACRGEKADERIAALLELRGHADELDPLLKAYGRLRDRNDPVVAALLLALARTREKDAVDTLLDVVGHGSPFLQFYAAASLLYANGDAKLEDERIRRAVTGLGDKDDPPFDALAACAQKMASSNWQGAIAEIPEIEDPRNLRLFFGREERNWHEVNRLLVTIFELGVVLEQFDSKKPGRETESAVGGGGGAEETRKAPSGSAEDQDLFDLLIPPNKARKPYFGPGDLGRG